MLLEQKNYKQLDKLVKGLDIFMKADIVKDGEGYIKKIKDLYMPLVIEKIDKNLISLAHYGKQNGDLMYDPEIVIEINTEQKTARPISFANSYLGIRQEVYNEDEHGQKQTNTKLLNDLTKYLSEWLENLKEQGFYK